MKSDKRAVERASPCVAGESEVLRRRFGRTQGHLVGVTRTQARVYFCAVRRAECGVVGWACSRAGTCRRCSRRRRLRSDPPCCRTTLKLGLGLDVLTAGERRFGLGAGVGAEVGDAGSPATASRNREAIASSYRTCPNATAGTTLRRRGVGFGEHTRPNPPWRSRPRSFESAPEAISATGEQIFNLAFAPFSVGTHRCLSASSPSPTRGHV
jgi:hypothetical protein